MIFFTNYIHRVKLTFLVNEENMVHVCTAQLSRIFQELVFTIESDEELINNNTDSAELRTGKVTF